MKVDRRAELAKLTKEQLLDYIDISSKNLWTLQNNYMWNLGKRFGDEVAVEFDDLCFGRMMQVEARRLQKFLNLGNDLLALAKCWTISLAQELGLESEWVELTPKRIYWRCTRCPMQLRRLKDGASLLPCKEVCEMSYPKLGRAINPKIKMTKLYAPPDPHTEDDWCGVVWEMED